MDQKTRIELYLREIQRITTNHPELITLRRDNPQEYEAQMERKLPTFKEKYPTLFRRMIMEFDAPEFRQKLSHFLGVSHSVHAGRRTLEDASRQIGQEAYDQYVKPIVDTLPKDNSKDTTQG